MITLIDSTRGFVQLTEDEASRLQAALAFNQLRNSGLTSIGSEGTIARLNGSTDRIMVYTPQRYQGIFLDRAEALEQLSNQRHAGESLSYTLKNTIDFGADYYV